MLFQKKYLIGQELVRRQLISQENLDVALMENERTGDRLGRILVRCGFISEDDLLNVLSDQLGLPVYKVLEKEIPQDVIDAIPAKLARAHKIIPVKKDEHTLTICMSDPLSQKEIDDIIAHIKKKISIVIDSDKNVLQCIKKYYGVTDKKDLEELEEEELEK